MFTCPTQRADTVPAWISEVPPLLVCLSCQGDPEKSCTDCSASLPSNPISDEAIRAASNLLQRVVLTESEPVLLLQALIWDIETICDDYGNPYPGTYPYWESIPGYVIARDYLRQLDKRNGRTV